MKPDILERILELVNEDNQLHTAIIATLYAYRDAERSRARWYDRRERKAHEQT